jgi:putative ABC transport system permease protein
METLKIAIRNITRNRRRSELTVITVVIGVFILMNAQGMLRGFTTMVYGHMMAMDTAQVQIENVGYRVDARRLPLDFVIPSSAILAEKLRTLPGVIAVSQRIDASFELTNGRESVTTTVRGASQEEARVTDLGSHIVQGSMFQPGKPGLVIGKGLAVKLGLTTGDTAFFTALDRHSARNLGSAPITGIFDFGYPLLDDSLVYLDIDQLRPFLDLGPVATRIVIRGRDPQASARLTGAVEAALRKWEGSTASDTSELKAYEWRTFAESLVSTIETRFRFLMTILGTLFVLIIAGIFNTMAMNVQERYGEIGTLRAIGMRRTGLVKVFLAEGMVMGLAGCIIAAIPATIVGLWLGIRGIDMTGVLPRDIPIPFGSILRASYSAEDALRALAAGVGAAALGSFLPARRASRLPITEALGTVR